MVDQRNKSDCAIAAIANATGNSYKVVKSRFGKLGRGGVQYHELVWLLSEFGSWHEVRPRRPPLVNQWLNRHEQGKFVLVLRSGFLDEYHAVAVVDGTVMGHYHDTWPVTNYFRLEEDRGEK